MMGQEHLRVTELLGRANVRGVLEPNEGSFAAASSLYGGAKLRRYDSLEEVIADPKLDAVIVSTPNFTHASLFEALIRSNKALLIEKPMATTLKDAARMVEYAQERAEPVQLGMQYRYKSQYVELFHRIKTQSAVGPIKTLSVSEYRPPFLDKVEQWNKFNANTGGTLVEKCCHYFDLMNLMAERRPSRVYASGGQAVNFLDFERNGERSDIDDHAFVIVDYEDSIRASFTLNMFCAELFEEMVVTGPKGRLVAKETASFQDRPSRATVLDDTDAHRGIEEHEVTYAPAIERSGHHGATYFEHVAFLDAVEGKPVDAATPLQGLWAMILASAAQRSIREARPVDIQEHIQEEMGQSTLVKEGRL